MKNPFVLLVLVATAIVLWVFNQPINIETGQDSGQQP
jgi:hypothetical protein